MVLASWALVIITAIVALITFLYMRHTRRLADDTKRMADVIVEESKPQIAPNIQIEKRGGKFQGNCGSRDFEVINKGASPARVSKFVLEWWYKRSPDKIYTMPEVIDKVLGGGESQPLTIPVNKGDMVKDDFQEGKSLSLHQLRGLAKGRAYAIYIDRNGNEDKTRDFPLEHPF